MNDEEYDKEHNHFAIIITRFIRYIPLYRSCGFLGAYISYANYISNLKINIKQKPPRMPIFPEYISENIARYVYFQKYKRFPKPLNGNNEGDFIDGKIRCEVKGGISDGPASFGPSAKWDYLYYVVAKNYLEMRFEVFEIKLSNSSHRWRNIIFYKTTGKTYGDIADANKRGDLRSSFKNIKFQLGNECTCIWDGHINDLF